MTDADTTPAETEPEKTELQAKPDTGTEKAAPKRRRRWPWVVAALGVLFLAGAGTGIYFLPALKDRLPFVATWLPEQDKANAELVAMRARLGQVEHRLSALNREVTGHGDDIARLNAEDTRLATGIARVEALAQTVQAAPPAAAPAEPAPRQAPAVEPEDRGPLSARLDMLMLRIGQIESAFVPLSEKVGRQEGAAAERTTLAARTQTLDAKINALGDRLARLEAAALADAKQALLVLTYAAARRAAEAGRPIAAEVHALVGLAEGDARAALQPALDQLLPLSTTLTPTVSALKERFPATVRSVLDAARLPEDANWWQRVWARLTGLVTLRRTGEVAGDNAAATVARAERRLESGDLKGAVEALDRLAGPAARAAEPWLADARRRLDLDAALDNVELVLRAMALEAPAPKEGA